ncbi:MAG: hypothetical protein ACFE9R_21645 [Candidatus Hermodarchaeota archaeon]
MEIVRHANNIMKNQMVCLFVKEIMDSLPGFSTGEIIRWFSN